MSINSVFLVLEAFFELLIFAFFGIALGLFFSSGGDGSSLYPFFVFGVTLVHIPWAIEAYLKNAQQKTKPSQYILAGCFTIMMTLPLFPQIMVTNPPLAMFQGGLIIMITFALFFVSMTFMKDMDAE